MYTVKYRLSIYMALLGLSFQEENEKMRLFIKTQSKFCWILEQFRSCTFIITKLWGVQKIVNIIVNNNNNNIIIGERYTKYKIYIKYGIIIMSAFVVCTL